MRRLLHIATAIIAIITLLTAGASAQRRITPVGEPQPPKTTAAERAAGHDPNHMVHAHDSLGNVIFIDTVTGEVDTVPMPQKKSKMIYPLIYNVAIGVDVWDLAARCFGQSYGLGSVWAELNMHNRYFPFAEVGLGNADDTPVNSNFTFKTKTAPFFKVGIGYNIFYNSNPDYQLKVGLRYGITHFTYQVTDATVDVPYWGITDHFSLPEMTSTTGYWELVASVKVKVWRNLSAGWALKYHNILHQSEVVDGKPMIVPGYGRRSNSFTGSFSIIYTLPLNKPKAKSVQKSEGD